MFWFNGTTVEVIDRLSGEVRPPGHGSPFTRTLIRPRERDKVTVTGIPWHPGTGEITSLCEIRLEDGTTSRCYPSRLDLALRYTADYMPGYVESFWKPFDAKTARELISGRDVVYDSKRDNRPATVLVVSSIGPGSWTCCVGSALSLPACTTGSTSATTAGLSVKAGQAQWKLTLEKQPERFAFAG
ncbi:hypothetical protein AB0P17_29695 [Streptomyces sp. NPDC088124]|uniref:hypothetical protein n=1 Tax=Streptomyces sp. NPDC088124 TaxID=3154654 RepID=UPI0034250F0F